jgi:hypothetical protein
MNRVIGQVLLVSQAFLKMWPRPGPRFLLRELLVSGDVAGTDLCLSVPVCARPSGTRDPSFCGYPNRRGPRTVARGTMGGEHDSSDNGQRTGPAHPGGDCQ